MTNERYRLTRLGSRRASRGLLRESSRPRVGRFGGRWTYGAAFALEAERPRLRGRRASRDGRTRWQRGRARRRCSEAAALGSSPRRPRSPPSGGGRRAKRPAWQSRRRGSARGDEAGRPSRARSASGAGTELRGSPRGLPAWRIVASFGRPGPTDRAPRRPLAGVGGCGSAGRGTRAAGATRRSAARRSTGGGASHPRSERSSRPTTPIGPFGPNRSRLASFGRAPRSSPSPTSSRPRPFAGVCAAGDSWLVTHRAELRLRAGWARNAAAVRLCRAVVQDLRCGSPRQRSPRAPGVLRTRSSPGLRSRALRDGRDGNQTDEGAEPSPGSSRRTFAPQARSALTAGSPVQARGVVSPVDHLDHRGGRRHPEPTALGPRGVRGARTWLAGSGRRTQPIGCATACVVWCSPRRGSRHAPPLRERDTGAVRIATARSAGCRRGVSRKGRSLAPWCRRRRHAARAAQDERDRRWQHLQ